jgi:hypothetical protein
MIRSLFQCLLCISLCPLLAAQQIIADAQQQATQQPAPPAVVTTLVQPVVITTPAGISVELAALDALSAANATVGQRVSLAVARDAINNGATAISAGTPVNGIITKVRYGSYKSNRGDQLDVRLIDSAPGTLVKLRLATISSPEPTYPDEPMPAYSGYPTRNGPSSHAGPPIFAVIVCAAVFIALGLKKN